MIGRLEQEHRALSRTFGDYLTLRMQTKGLNLPELDLVAVNCTTEDLPLDEPIFDRLRTILRRAEVEGWCRFRSTVTWSGAKDNPSYAEAGPPLFAEWAELPERSTRLRLLSGSAPTQARIWTFTERNLDADEPLREGEICALREKRQALPRAAPPGIRSLVYHVFWGAEPHEDVHALRRRFDRFTGFHKE